MLLLNVTVSHIRFSELHPSLNLAYCILLFLDFLACQVTQLHSSLSLEYKIFELRFSSVPSFDTSYWSERSYLFHLLYLFVLLFTTHIVYIVCPLVFSLLRCVLSLGYSVIPSQQLKPSNSQRNFVFNKNRRLNYAIFTALQEKDNGFDLQQAQRSLKDHFAEAEQMTMYFVDHLPEDITEVFLNFSFTYLQDEIDDTVKEFKQMLKETNQLTDPVEPSQIQQPSSHNQPTCHDKLPSTSALPHLPDSLGDQLTHRNTSSPQQPTITNIRRKFQHYQCHDQS